ncbi:MAG TPA: hypothetical protein VIF44_01795 [Candidatus Limnocylindrales bacterium]
MGVVDRRDPPLSLSRSATLDLGTGRAVAGAEVRRLDSLVRAARPWALESGG